MKPFDRKRFAEALRRAKKQMTEPEADAEARILRLLERMLEKKPLDHFVVKQRDRTFLLAVPEIDWIEAEGKYVRLHAAGAAHPLAREWVGEAENPPAPRRFLRIHRGTIVNVKRIQEMHRGFGGAVFVVLRDGTKLTMSRRYRTRIREVTGMEV